MGRMTRFIPLAIPLVIRFGRHWFATTLMVVGVSGLVQAQNVPPEANRLPADATTHHALELPGRTLRFAATAGAILLTDDKGNPQAEVAVIAYRREDPNPQTRPVTFVFNGGPGMASGWLQVGAIGPWRIALDGDAGIPSARAAPAPNAETWLDFTDLVFVDPPGTGYSRILASGEEARRHLWSVNGDIEALAQVIRRWLDRNERSVSPKYILGESYGGFRGPRLARALQSDQGVGIAGLVLVSPVLDFGWRGSGLSPFNWVDRLPSQVAAARALDGPVSRDELADVEHYAATDYLLDLLRGERDAAAIERMSGRVAELTGLDVALVRRFRGRLDNDVFLHELDRAHGRVGSIYDATIARADPDPRRLLSSYPDPVLEGFKAPVTSAMVAIYADKLHWRPEGVYQLANKAASQQWQWGRGMGAPEAISHLRNALALDPRMRVLIAHGVYDLITPYFATALILDQLPSLGEPNRVRLDVYPGGHMFYSRDASRAAFRDAAQALFVIGATASGVR
jgi:carboxypeptidase C (cathepsin A)